MYTICNINILSDKAFRMLVNTVSCNLYTQKKVLIRHHQRSTASLCSVPRHTAKKQLSSARVAFHHFNEYKNLISALFLLFIIQICIRLCIPCSQMIAHMETTDDIIWHQTLFLCGRLASVNFHFVAIAMRSYGVPSLQYINEICFNLIVYIAHDTTNTHAHAHVQSNRRLQSFGLFFIQFGQHIFRWPLFQTDETKKIFIIHLHSTVQCTLYMKHEHYAIIIQCLL